MLRGGGNSSSYSKPKIELREELEVSQRKRPRLKVINICFVFMRAVEGHNGQKKPSASTSGSEGDDDDGEASSGLHSDRQRKKDKIKKDVVLF